MIISLCGFMGCGKSTIGKALSKRMGCRFIDLDEAIEEKEGRNIPEIFASDGESYFRNIEILTLKEVLEEGRSDTSLLVLSLGGGTLGNEEAVNLVKESTFCIYLRATAETLFKVLDGWSDERPVLGGAKGEALKERICELLSAREASYMKAARKVVDTDEKEYENVVKEIETILKPYHYVTQ